MKEIHVVDTRRPRLDLLRAGADADAADSSSSVSALVLDIAERAAA